MALNVDASPDALDQMIIWRINDPRYTDRTNIVKGKKMLRQWTIEFRADFADKDKNDAVTEAGRIHAVALAATLAMIKDNGISPQVSYYSDDFFTGHEDISLMQNSLGEAQAADDGTKSESMEISEDMMQAMRDMEHDKNNT